MRGRLGDIVLETGHGRVLFKSISNLRSPIVLIQIQEESEVLNGG